MTEKNYPYAISFSHASKIIQQQVCNQVLKTETIEIDQALHRILASNLQSPIQVPTFDCSRMDGYAIKFDVYSDHQDGKFKITEPQFAGEGLAKINDLKSGLFAVPVMTGALLPEVTDTVVMKEHVICDGETIQFSQPVKKAQHVRKTGSDIKQGQILLKTSHKITAADLGLLSSVGLHQLAVYKKPKVALIMTGNELVKAGQITPEMLSAGQVYDSISFMLMGLLQQMGCEVNLLPVLQDDITEVTQRFNTLSQQSYDLVVTAGGVSMGDRDLLPKVFASTGTVLFHKCLIKPGFPLLFGKLGEALYFGLPGNPVSAFVTCFEFIYPVLLGLFKAENQSLLCWRAEILQDLVKPHMKREFVRGFYTVNAKGGLEVMVCGDQQSSRVKSLSEANCLIVMNESQLEFKRGQIVVIQPFNQLF
ncbi:MAG: molybdopterin molybdotransferase MoeA [Marinicella sp.]